MSEETLITLSWVMIAFAAIVFAALKFRKDPAGYGRYADKQKFGINPKWAWIIQESPSFFIPLYFWLSGTSTTGFYLNSVILVHYFYRTFIYPLRIRSKNRNALGLVIGAFLFCAYNGYLQGEWNAYYQEEESLNIRHFFGAVIFLSGMYINHSSDNILFGLRTPGKSEYKIPYGGLFEYVSCPNYLGEIIEWIGYAIVAWNLPALAFAIFTAANIGPRALSHHQWYKTKFQSYPKQRRALIPYII
uniref:3-oxo-5alpha-steroid 4-dehydrogenase (NADP(+)) n=1 Tax=Caenorhabditis tropicalis TaxID=1561998 RepID=A0A1I7U1P3_9PELO